MEYYKISKLLNDSTVTKFATKKYSSGQYFANKNVRLKASMLRSDLCDCALMLILM